MAERKRKYRTIYLVTAALMVAMIGGYALAATSLTNPGPTQTSNVTTSPTAGFALASITSEQLVVISTAMAGVATAGTQIGTTALEGTMTPLATCAAAPCAPVNLRPVNPATETQGDYGEQIVMTVVQQLTGTGSLGFDFSMTISITVGLVTSSVVFQGYIGTGTTTAAATVNIPVYLFADLATTTAPVINSINVVFNQCSSGTACP